MKKILGSLLVFCLFLMTGVPIYAQTNSDGQTTSPVDWSLYEADIVRSGKIVGLNQLYFNDSPMVLESKGIEFSINRYGYYNFQGGDSSNKSFNGFIVEVTYKNKSDVDVNIQTDFIGEIMNSYDFAFNFEYPFNNDELDLAKKAMKTQNVLPANSELTGAFIINIQNMSLKALEEDGNIYLNSPTITPVNGSSTDYIFTLDKLFLSISEEANSGNLATLDNFYNDKITTNNMGTKTLIDEVEVNQSGAFNDVEATILSYQVTEFVPNEHQGYFQADEGKNIILTFKIKLKNNSTKIVDSKTVTGVIYLTEYDAFNKTDEFDYYSSDILLQNIIGNDELNNGEEMEIYFVFALSPEDYEHFKNNPAVLSFLIFAKPNETLSWHDLFIKIK